MTVRELLSGIEYKYDLPVYEQGTIAEDAPYPPEFVTFDIYNSTFQDFLDDEANGSVYSTTVIYYSDRPETLDSTSDEILEYLVELGFIPQGRSINVPSDEPSHRGRSMEFLYYLKETTKNGKIYS